MTERESQILELIKKNPLITQQELADSLCIERSSVAVHISNLTKKGIIKGRGYIMETTNYIVVIGGSNMDILGTPDSSLILEDSNPGTISLSPGGVGRNIAENLAYMEIDVKLLSAIGSDVYGNKLISHTNEAGVDTHYIMISEQDPTSLYMSILDETGDMKVAISHMDITANIDAGYIKKNKSLIENATFLVIDLNLSPSTIEYIMKTFKNQQIIVDTVSVTKSTKIKPYLENVYAIKPNKKEAEAILNVKLTTDKEIETALLTLMDKGVVMPMISLGSSGIAFIDKGNLLISKHPQVEVTNANGAGDAFTAGVCYGFYHHMTLGETIQFAQKAATAALHSKETVGGPHLFNHLIRSQS